MKFEVEFYTLENGKQPAADFIRSLHSKMQVKAMDALRILEDEGTRLREPYSKHAGEGLFELRIKFSSDIARVFYFFIIGGKIVVTNGYIKKQQRADTKELERAYKYKADYERRLSK
ncbi:MAG: type II toxin-antitoxin system RelE/ParE family toxin [Christensenellaceae bacterium]|jgi:phage-related protein|nr:type II toxin-antitoxin system RelE/ParE family toxin [Christensenellaceae bacterium]